MFQHDRPVGDISLRFHSSACARRKPEGPIGLEHMTSSDPGLMERSFNQDAYTGPFITGSHGGRVDLQSLWGRASALMAFGCLQEHRQRVHLWVGDGAYAVDGRLTYLLWEECEGRQLCTSWCIQPPRSTQRHDAGFDLVVAGRNVQERSIPCSHDTRHVPGRSQDMPRPRNIDGLGSFQVQSEYVARR